MNQKYEKQFSRRLRELLSASGLTCEELAQRLEVPVPLVRRWENGTSLPDVAQFRAVARIFGMPYAWFLDEYDGFPSAEALAERLGLSEDTVEGLLALAGTEPEEVLGLLDDTIYAAVSAVKAVREDVM